MTRETPRQGLRVFLRLSVGSLILTALGLDAFVPGQNRPALRTGTISGRVIAEDGQNVDGASVYCSVSGISSPARTQTTDGEGQFSFAGLTPAAYRIGARMPGYVLATSVGIEGQIVRIGESVTLSLVKGGVITGRVTNASGAPVVAVQVLVRRVRDAEGRVLLSDTFASSRQTDDRGIYRMYGLTAGSYHVIANPMSGPGLASAYNLDTSTYFPTSNRDGATEVKVQAGEEVTGIDISYRGERGHTISGTVEGGSERGPIEYAVGIDLQEVGGGRSVGSGMARSVGGVTSFVVNGVGDGDYLLVAYSYPSQEVGHTTAPRRVSVRGSDVSGIKLTLVPLASIAGNVAIEAAAVQNEKCSKTRESGLVETYMNIRRDEKEIDRSSSERYIFTRSGALSERGEFVLRHLRAGQYRLVPDLPEDNWYVKEMSAPGTPASKRIDLGRGPIVVKSGDKISGATMTIAEGAAGMKGKLTGEKAKLGRWRVHLIPVDATQAENALRWYEVIAGADGTFVLSHLAPGKYWIISKLLVEDQPADVPVRPVAWESLAERTKLRNEAEAAKLEIDLKSCARIKDYILPVQ